MYVGHNNNYIDSGYVVRDITGIYYALFRWDYSGTYYSDILYEIYPIYISIEIISWVLYCIDIDPMK